jgi:hypothetical protein
MKSWCKVMLEWAVGMLQQVFMPLFLSYRIPGGFTQRRDENGDEWVSAARSDKRKPNHGKGQLRRTAGED